MQALHDTYLPQIAESEKEREKLKKEKDDLENFKEKEQEEFEKLLAHRKAVAD